MSTLETSLYYAERINNSVNGNPRYRLATAHGSILTMSDASCSYDVDNIARRIPHGESLPVVLSLTRAGRVWNITRKA